MNEQIIVLNKSYVNSSEDIGSVNVQGVLLNW